VQRGDGKEKRLRGIIFLGGRSDYSPEEVSLLGVPYVCCSYTNSYGTLPSESYSSVSIADEQEAYRAVSELYQNGHRRIAVLTAAPDDSRSPSSVTLAISARCATSA